MCFSLEMVHIPIWLLVAGILVLVVPAVYYIYDAFCKPEDVNPGMVKIFMMVVWTGMMLMMMMIAQIVNDCRVSHHEGLYASYRF